GRERRALAARRDVAAAEVGDDANAGELGEQGGIADLRGETELRPVADRLAMAADGAGRPGAGTCRGEQLSRGGGIRASARVGREGDVLDFIPARAVEREELSSQRRRKGDVGVAAHARQATAEIGEHRVDPVEAGARHQADVELRPGRSPHYSALASSEATG